MWTDRERRECLQGLANHPLLDGASSGTVEAFLGAATFHRAAPGTVLLSKGDAPEDLYFLLRGTVRLFDRTVDGREFTTRILAAPNHFGDGEILASRVCRGQSVESLTDAWIALLPAQALRDALVKDHGTALGWISALADQLVNTVEASRLPLSLSLPGRIAAVLLALATVHGVETPRGVEFSLPLSRERLARHVGSVKRAVLRVMQDFTRRGWVDSSDGRVVLRSADALRRQTANGPISLLHSSRTGGLTPDR